MGNSIGQKPKRVKRLANPTRPRANIKRLRENSKSPRRSYYRPRGSLASPQVKVGMIGRSNVRENTANAVSNSDLRSMIAAFRESLDFRPLQQSDAPVKDRRILVCARKRPFNERETARNMLDVVSVPCKDEIVVHEGKLRIDMTPYLKSHHFRFDYVFDDTSTNRLVYKFTAKPLVRNIFKGGTSTCIAYGQTGSGKTHTMGRCEADGSRNALYAMAAEKVFKSFPKFRRKFSRGGVCVSFFEIYNGYVFDLLSKKAKLQIRDDRMRRMEVVGLTVKAVKSFKALLLLLEEGNKARTSRRTWANYSSSRSHAVFQITLRKEGVEGIYGKLTMIDLAGSEGLADVQSKNNQRKFECAEISRSLLSLRECIRAMATDRSHIPFRCTKLTQVLRDSFIGNDSMICIIGMISPGMRSCGSTLDTLRFLNHIKEQKSIIEEQVLRQQQQRRQAIQQKIQQLHHEEDRKRKQMLERRQMNERIQQRHGQPSPAAKPWAMERREQNTGNAARTNSSNELRSMVMNYRAGTVFRPLRQSDPVKKHRIAVCIRKRPLSRAEKARREVDVVSVTSKEEVVVHESRVKFDLSKYLRNRQFIFDYVFDDSFSNKMVYKYTAKPLVKNVFKGGTSTCIAYGETGSGKTHTMGGGRMTTSINEIYSLTAKDIFKLLRSYSSSKSRLAITASFFEIYNGNIFDLLASKAKLRIRDDPRTQVEVIGLTEIVVNSVDEVLQLIDRGNRARTSRKTMANYSSSRSHAIFEIKVWKVSMPEILGKFAMVDLAGSERQSGLGRSQYKARIESAQINTSLLALRECVRALGSNRSHIPFRDSKLTHILRDSFIGNNSKICIIGTIKPGTSSCGSTLQTLQFLDVVKEKKKAMEEQMEEQLQLRYPQLQHGTARR
jgi:hypothetical protein